MTNTERKLDEARFFLNRLNINDPYFDYILSAYLNASRSVLWVMKNEFLQIKGWTQWHNVRTLDENEENILREINKLRIRVTKQDGVKTDFFIDGDSICVDEDSYAKAKKILKWPSGTKLKITISELNEGKNKNNGSNPLSLHCRVKTRNGKIALCNRKKLLNLCKNYFLFLEQIASECLINFKLIND